MLVIDDDPGVREIIEASLAQAGFRVTALPDGKRISQILLGGDVAMAIVDRSLRDEDGLAITRRLPERYVIGIATVSGRSKLRETLVTHANRVLSRDQLLNPLCDRHTPAFDRSIDVKVDRLRRKLGDDPDNPRMIRTVRNGGYVFVADATAP